jgi:cellulase/cellobiase CelA1
LSELTLRYWYTRDSNRPQNFFCDWAQLDCANITGNFVELSNPVDNADIYLEVSFNTAAGSLGAGANSGEIHLRLAQDDWRNYDERNDYSADLTRRAFVDWSRVTLYRNGALVWGEEPDGVNVPAPTANPATAPTSSPAASGTQGVVACRVNYTVSDQWPGGFNANVTISNQSGAALNGWELTWTFPADQRIINLWNGKVSQSGADVVVTDAGWNAQVPAGGTVEFGFQAIFSGTNSLPTAFALNGEPCN